MPDQRAADLLGDLRGRQARPRSPCSGSGVTRISGVPLDRSDLRLMQVARRTGPPAPRRWPARRRRVLARDDDVEGVRGEPGRLGDRDVEAVGPDRRQLVGELLRVRGQVDVVVEADRHPGAVGGAAARGGDDRLEAGLALARDARLDEHHLGVGEQDVLGLIARSSTASVDAPAGGAIVTARIFSEPALMNCVGSSGASRPVEQEQRHGRCPTTPSLSSGCGAPT